MDKILVSVIVPVYNAEGFISRCLDSLVNQTLKEIEIICVNDASTDKSINILYAYQSIYPNIIVVDLPVNKKQGGARNAGLDIAVGEYIGFVDSDDWVDHTMYEKLYNETINKNLDVVDCNYFYAYNHKKIATDSINEKNILSGELTEPIVNFGRLWTKIIKNKVFNGDEKLRFPEGIFYEDNYLTPFLAILIKSYGKVNDPLYFYFQNEGSTTNKRNDIRFFDRLTSAEMMFSDFTKITVSFDIKEQFFERFFNIYAYNTVIMLPYLFDDCQKNEILRIRAFLNDNNIKSYKFYKKMTFIKKVRYLIAFYFPDLYHKLIRMR
ncbi:TPA: glycosyltransferase family 2 protein [Photobacterium damselae]